MISYPSGLTPLLKLQLPVERVKQSLFDLKQKRKLRIIPEIYFQKKWFSIPFETITLT
jgi:hypothetical protein